MVVLNFPSRVTCWNSEFSLARNFWETEHLVCTKRSLRGTLPTPVYKVRCAPQPGPNWYFMYVLISLLPNFGASMSNHIIEGSSGWARQAGQAYPASWLWPISFLWTNYEEKTRFGHPMLYLHTYYIYIYIIAFLPETHSDTTPMQPTNCIFPPACDGRPK